MPETITPEELAQRLHAAGAGRMHDYLRRTMRAWGIDAERYAKVNATTRLRRRTGNLAASIHHEVRGQHETLTGVLRAGGRFGGQDVAYAGVQEHGATITGKPWLTIPLDDAMTRAGVTRRTARDFTDAFFIRANGKLFLVRKQGDALQFLFMLVHSVTIKGKRYLGDAFDKATDELPGALDGILGRAVEA